MEGNSENLTYQHAEFKRRKRIYNKQSLLYDVPSNGNCLFWSVAIAFLMPVRNNNDLFRIRFIQLFGEENSNYLSMVQELFHNFELLNHNNNHSLFNSIISRYLIETVFRNRVVDYISFNLNRFRGENRATFSSAILADVRQLNPMDISDEQIIENYLNNIRLTGNWGGFI